MCPPLIYPHIHLSTYPPTHPLIHQSIDPSIPSRITENLDYIRHCVCSARFPSLRGPAWSAAEHRNTIAVSKELGGDSFALVVRGELYRKVRARRSGRQLIKRHKVPVGWEGAWLLLYPVQQLVPSPGNALVLGFWILSSSPLFEEPCSSVQDFPAH